MPPWSGLVSAEEARWLVELMKGEFGSASTNE
jgi:hypothetical protein